MLLELNNAGRCPFVQRSVITSNRKGIEHRMTLINLDDPPDLFRELITSRNACAQSFLQ